MRENVEELETFKIEGKRHKLEPGRWFKVKRKRGWYKVHRLDSFPDGTVEALTWWVSSRQTKNPQAAWRTVALTGDNAQEVSQVSKN